MLSKHVLEELKRYIEARQDRQQVMLAPEPISFKTLESSMARPLEEDLDLDDFINNRKKPGFTQTLLQMMDAHGGKDSEIYTKAGIDRRHFSKIRSNPKYKPSKHTAIALALALKLNKNKTDTLLASAGYALSDSETFDLVICWCIEKRIYDIDEVNQALDYFSQKTIGTIA